MTRPDGSIMDNETRVRADLRDKQISRPDAIERLVEMRYARREAIDMVSEWLDAWEFQKDTDDEREQGWSA